MLFAWKFRVGLTSVPNCMALPWRARSKTGSQIASSLGYVFPHAGMESEVSMRHQLTSNITTEHSSQAATHVLNLSSIRIPLIPERSIRSAFRGVGVRLHTRILSTSRMLKRANMVQKLEALVPGTLTLDTLNLMEP